MHVKRQVWVPTRERGNQLKGFPLRLRASAVNAFDFVFPESPLLAESRHCLSASAFESFPDTLRQFSLAVWLADKVCIEPGLAVVCGRHFSVTRGK